MCKYTHMMWTSQRNALQESTDTRRATLQETCCLCLSGNSKSYVNLCSECMRHVSRNQQSQRGGRPMRDNNMKSTTSRDRFDGILDAAPYLLRSSTCFRAEDHRHWMSRGLPAKNAHPSIGLPDFQCSDSEKDTLLCALLFLYSATWQLL